MRLDIPAQPAFVGVARAVVATVATTVEGIDDDRLEDLRLAVSEACTNAVEGQDESDEERGVGGGVAEGYLEAGAYGGYEQERVFA